MKCSSCHIESENLRPYAAFASASEGQPPLRLCPACRVLNSLHPRYRPLPVATHGDAIASTLPHGLDPGACDRASTS